MSASFVNVQVKVSYIEVGLLFTAGEKDAVHEGGAVFTVTVAVQVFVSPPVFRTVRVQVCVVVGVITCDPVAPTKVPDPRLPVHV